MRALLFGVYIRGSRFLETPISQKRDPEVRMLLAPREAESFPFVSLGDVSVRHASLRNGEIWG